MPQFKFFGSDPDKDSIVGDTNQSSEPSQLITNKQGFHETKESGTSSDSEETSSLLDDEDFIEIRRKHAASAEASVKEFGEKTLKTIQMAFGKITNTGECEEKAYQVLKELKGLEGTSIPGVADADAVYEAVFDKIANEYTSNKVLVGHIERGFRVLPREAEVLPTIFSNFPNILNDVKLKEEEQPRPRSPWNF
jgi:hypothetical protein